MKRILSVLMAVLMGLTSFGCATAPTKPIMAAQATGSFDPNFTYQVTLRDNAGGFRRKGSDLEWREDRMLVKDRQGQALASYSREAIQEIRSIRPIGKRDWD